MNTENWPPATKAAGFLHTRHPVHESNTFDAHLIEEGSDISQINIGGRQIVRQDGRGFL